MPSIKQAAGQIRSNRKTVFPYTIIKEERLKDLPSAKKEETMGKVISIANQKGGVGKTTTALSLSSALALSGRRTLLVDLDPQGSASSGLGVSVQTGLYQALMGQCLLKEVVFPTSVHKLDLIPANTDLAGAEIELVNETERVFFLKKIISTVKQNYNFILIDTPPSLGLLTLNALCASDAFIVPLQCEYYALEGLSRLLETAREVKERWNFSLKLQGILLTLFDARNSLSYRVEQEVRRHFEKQVFQTIIPRNVRLSEAPSFGKIIFQYEPHCLGAMAYEQLAAEFQKQISYQEKVPVPPVQTSERPPCVP